MIGATHHADRLKIDDVKGGFHYAFHQGCGTTLETKQTKQLTSYIIAVTVRTYSKTRAVR